MARRSFLDHVPIPLKQIYPMACDGKDAASAAAEYEALLKRHFEGAFPSFDLVFLGLGENGHTASLFPGTAVLRERRRWVRAMSLPEQEMHRLSLTAPAINRAERILFLVSGAGKADVLHTVLQGPRDPERWPAQLIEPANGELYWYADADAAARIHRQ
jgi:6-phosphogluconolactonase